MTKFLKHLLICLTSSIFLSSCAVLFNKDYTVVHIESEIPNTTAQVIPDSQVYNAPVTLGVLRSRSNLEIRFKNDTLDSVFQVKSRIDPWVWGNLYTYGCGMLIDLTHPRGRTYPAHIRLTKKGLETFTQRQWRKRSWYNKRRGLFGIYAEWSLMNVQTSYDGSGYLSRGAPMLNAGLGMNYYLSQTKFIDFCAGFASTNIGENFDRGNMYSQMHSWYYRLSYQQEVRDFKFGVGLSLLHQFVYNPSEPIGFSQGGSSARVMNIVNPLALGPCLGLEWQAGEFVGLGANYMTGLFAFNTNQKWAYRDLILAISFKLRLPFSAERTKEYRPRSYKISDYP